MKWSFSQNRDARLEIGLRDENTHGDLQGEVAFCYAGEDTQYACFIRVNKTLSTPYSIADMQKLQAQLESFLKAFGG